MDCGLFIVFQLSLFVLRLTGVNACKLISTIEVGGGVVSWNVDKHQEKGEVTVICQVGFGL